MMNIMSAAALPSSASLANLPHGLSLTVMKKGMEAEAQQAAQMIQKMMPPTPGLGEHIDIYV